MLDNQRQGGNNREGGSREATLERSQISAPAISLPKGGGAIRGIGEKFAANPVTGTGSPLGTLGSVRAVFTSFVSLWQVY